MRCRQCHERLVKEKDGELQFFCRKLLVRKSDQALTIVCSNCGTPVEATPEILVGLRKAILVPVVSSSVAGDLRKG